MVKVKIWIVAKLGPGWGWSGLGDELTRPGSRSGSAHDCNWGRLGDRVGVHPSLGSGSARVRGRGQLEDMVEVGRRTWGLGRPIDGPSLGSRSELVILSPRSWSLSRGRASPNKVMGSAQAEHQGRPEPIVVVNLGLRLRSAQGWWADHNPNPG